MSRRARLACIVAVSVITSAAAMAGSWWNPVPAIQSMFRKNRTDVLMICGNYARPRLLAELAQKKTGQPILLISPIAGGPEDLYILPKGSEAFTAAKNQFVEVVQTINPKQVVFLGDGDYLSAEYVDALQGLFPSVILPGEDWDKTAQALAKILDVGSSLPRRYGELCKVYDDELARHTLTVAPVAEPEVPSMIAPPATAEAVPAPAAPAVPAQGAVVVPAEAKAPAPEAPAPAAPPAALVPPEPKEIPAK